MHTLLIALLNIDTSASVRSAGRLTNMGAKTRVPISAAEWSGGPYRGRYNASQSVRSGEYGPFLPSFLPSFADGVGWMDLDGSGAVCPGGT